MKPIGAQLNAGADFSNLWRLLQHLDVKALTRQRQRSRQAANAAAGHQHRQVVCVVTHGLSFGKYGYIQYADFYFKQRSPAGDWGQP
jgi:hypothetical protein